MTREEKEKFICETWEQINDSEDVISLSALARLNEKDLDFLVECYTSIYGKGN